MAVCLNGGCDVVDSPLFFEESACCVGDCAERCYRVHANNMSFSIYLYSLVVVIVMGSLTMDSDSDGFIDNGLTHTHIHTQVMNSLHNVKGAFRLIAEFAVIPHSAT